jgi:hypothetical protein
MNKITVLTMVYNEEYLIPYFLRHYWKYDEIRVIYDSDTNDRTKDFLNFHNLQSEQWGWKIKIEDFQFSDGMDDDLKIEKLNQEYKTITEGYAILVDADEFVFVDRNQIQGFNAAYVKLYNVYRHVSEKDLDINISIRDQRRHGVFDPLYNKPIIVKAGLNIHWGQGNHLLFGAIPEEKGFIGAHWANADTYFCIDRRVKNRRARQSQHNLETGMTWQHHHCTEESIREECRQHENDPQVF